MGQPDTRLTWKPGTLLLSMLFAYMCEHAYFSVYPPTQMTVFDPQNNQDTIHRPNEAQEEGRPKYGYFIPS